MLTAQWSSGEESKDVHYVMKNQFIVKNKSPRHNLHQVMSINFREAQAIGIDKLSSHFLRCNKSDTFHFVSKPAYLHLIFKSNFEINFQF